MPPAPREAAVDTANVSGPVFRTPDEVAHAVSASAETMQINNFMGHLLTTSMHRTLYFDCETYSECDLKVHGTHRYADDPSTEITVAQWALDDEAPRVWDGTPYATEIRRALSSIQARSRRTWEIDPFIRRLLPADLVEKLEASRDTVAHNSARPRAFRPDRQAAVDG